MYLNFFPLQIKEARYDYTNCASVDAGTVGEKCADLLSNLTSFGQSCTCKVEIELNEDFTVGVFCKALFIGNVKIRIRDQCFFRRYTSSYLLTSLKYS